MSVCNIFLSVSKISKYLKLNRPQLRPLSNCFLEHDFLQRVLLSFRPRQLANQISEFKSTIFLDIFMLLFISFVVSQDC